MSELASAVAFRLVAAAWVTSCASPGDRFFGLNEPAIAELTQADLAARRLVAAQEMNALLAAVPNESWDHTSHKATVATRSEARRRLSGA